MVTLKRVLCPVDLSELSIDAFACGSSIAERSRSEKGIATDVNAGRAHRQISRVAADMKADLIVLGAHGRGDPAAAPLGPTTEHVVRAAPCPVLTVRRSRGQMSAQEGRHVPGL